MESKYVILNFFCLLLFFVIQISQLKASFIVFLDDVKCKTNLSYTYPINCSLNKSTSPAKGYVDFRMRREVKTQHYSLNLSITVNKKTRNLMSIKNYDACAFFEGRVNVLLKAFKQILDSYGHMPHKCPVPKDYQYEFRNVVVEFGKLPPYLMETDFYLSAKNTVGKDFLFSFEVFGRVRRAVEVNIEENKDDDDDDNNNDNKINKNNRRNKKGKKPRSKV